MKSHFFKLLFFIALFSFYSCEAQQYDLIIRNGHLIDAKNNLDQKMDLAIKDGKIAAIEKSIAPEQGKKVIDAEGLIVSPGLIDMHRWPARVHAPADHQMRLCMLLSARQPRLSGIL